MKHINIPLFVPHAGCPQQCVFCNQRTITGFKYEMTPDRAINEINTVLSQLSKASEAEIAFFGGSFTAIERSKMIALLEAVQPYIDNQSISSIRISTRPDAINSEILDILKYYRVKTIELGIQSISDRVLTASRRGHTALDSITACKLIVSHGFTLGCQMMIGLPESSPEDEIMTAQTIASLGAIEARIYPTVVFNDTELNDLIRDGSYLPLTLNEAVERCCNAMEIFEASSIKLLRIGLCESEGLRNGSIAGGAYHPAIGELCRSELFRRRFIHAIETTPSLQQKALHITVASGKLSAAIGQHRSNAEGLKMRFALPALRFSENQRLSGYDFEITAESEQLCD